MTGPARYLCDLLMLVACCGCCSSVNPDHQPAIALLNSPRQARAETLVFGGGHHAVLLNLGFELPGGTERTSWYHEYSVWLRDGTLREKTDEELKKELGTLMLAEGDTGLRSGYPAGTWLIPLGAVTDGTFNVFLLPTARSQSIVLECGLVSAGRLLVSRGGQRAQWHVDGPALKAETQRALNER